MKGKKADAQYISEFITNCIANGIDNPEGILDLAKKMVSNIDQQLKDIDNKRLVRSKLLDVVAAFEKPIKVSKVQEARVLSFFQIKNAHICRHICNAIKNDTYSKDDLINLCQPFSKHDIVFCVKQLLEHSVLAKSNGLLQRGETFDEYIKFVLREA